MEIALIILGCVFAAFLLACLIAFVTGFFGELWRRFKALERDAELWRHSEKPIGKLVSVEEDDEGLKFVGQLFQGSLPGSTEASFGPFSIDNNLHAEIPPKPEWELKKTWFDFDMDDALTMSTKDWDMFVKTVVQVWKNMLISDGYKLDTSITTHVGEGSSLNSVLGTQRVTLEVRCYKPDEVNWSRHTPPKGSRWVTPMECHGNDGFCTRCSPRNPNRKWVVRDA